MKNRLYLLLVLVGLLCLAAWTTHAQLQKSSTRQAWEYQEVQLPSNENATAALNRLGAQGWELVGVTSGCPSSIVSAGSCGYWAYVKRAK